MLRHLLQTTCNNRMGIAMKKIFISLAALFAVLQCLASSPKYVFFFIGDGMGVNIINYTQYYKAAHNGQHGTELLNFAKFPVCGVATTWCADRDITDSAASGTALATGSKTNYKYLGNGPDGKPLKNIPELAAEAGKKVAIVSTVGINHATPGSFVAHQNDRNYYDAITRDMIKAGFDFYAGSEIIRGKKENFIENFDPMKEFEAAGYTFASSRDDFKKKCKKAKKMVMIPDKEHKVTTAIDRPSSEGTPMTLNDMVESAVEFMMKDGGKEGFFIMAESGLVDYGTHANDGAASIQEILDLEKAVDFAIAFYNLHPDETAILVTSDHDTGGSAVLPRSMEQICYFDYQKLSSGTLTSMLKEKLKQCNYKMSWEEVKGFISEYTGLWDKIQVKEGDEKKLREVYDNTVAKAAAGSISDEYGHTDNAEIVAKAIKLLNKYAGLTWGTSGHSGSFVPVYYIGPHPEFFSQMNDNALLSQRMKQVMFD